MKVKPRNARRSRPAGGAKSSPAVVHGIVAPLLPHLVAIAELKLDGKNAKKHPRAQLEAIASSLKAHGQHRPAVFRLSDRVVVIGNGMVEAARDVLGWTHVAAIGLEDSAAESVSRAIADNSAAERGEWNVEVLREQLGDLPPALAAVAWFGGELPPLPPPLDRETKGPIRESKDPVREPTSAAGDTSAASDDPLGPGFGSPPPADEDVDEPDEATVGRVIEARKAPRVCQVGDLWSIGRHVLIVGDTTRPETLPRLLEQAGREKLGVDMVWTDPPFAIYGSSTGVDQSVADDSMVLPFFRAMFEQIDRVARKFAHVYVCCDWRSYPGIREESRGSFAPRNLIVWRKKSRSQHCFHYGHRHELISFFVHEPKRTSLFNVERGHRKINDDNVWDAPVVHVSRRWHFAEKPSENITRAIVNSSDVGDVVLDPFAGGASTLIVANRLERVCLLAEKLPKVADLILARAREELAIEPKLVSRETS